MFLGVALARFAIDGRGDATDSPSGPSTSVSRLVPLPGRVTGRVRPVNWLLGCRRPLSVAAADQFIKTNDAQLLAQAEQAEADPK